MSDNGIANTVSERLRAEFDPRDVQWKPSVLSKDGTQAMALAYVEARVVQDRLDSVVGMENWRDSYRVRGEHAGGDGAKVYVECTLSLRLGDEWIAKRDVGAGDDLKAAYSDAFKRAGVQWGVGRYLYDLPAVWADYDAQKRQFKNPAALASTLGKTRSGASSSAGSLANSAKAAAPALSEQPQAQEQQAGPGDHVVSTKAGRKRLADLTPAQVRWLAEQASSPGLRAAAFAYRDFLIASGRWGQEAAA
jgi:hypothetical protein